MAPQKMCRSGETFQGHRKWNTGPPWLSLLYGYCFSALWLLFPASTVWCPAEEEKMPLFHKSLGAAFSGHIIVSCLNSWTPPEPFPQQTTKWTSMLTQGNYPHGCAKGNRQKAIILIWDSHCLWFCFHGLKVLRMQRVIIAYTRLILSKEK